jgi:ubiquitin C-terminal hydrolase
MTEENGSNKRQREDTDDEGTNQESAKKAKYDNIPSKIDSTDTPGDQAPDELIETLTSKFHMSRTKMSFISGIWKVDIPLQLLDDSLFVYDIARRSETVWVELSLQHCAGIDNFTLTITVHDSEKAVKEVEQKEEEDKQTDESPFKQANHVGLNGYDSTPHTPARDNSEDINTGTPLRNSPVSGVNRLDLKGKPTSQLNIMLLDNEYYNIKVNIFIGQNVCYTESFSYIKPNSINRKEFVFRPTADFSLIIDIDVTKVDNRKTNYLGLINEGMTCYMNSMLQTLNLLGYLKRALFKLPLEIEDRKSLPYSLCKLFYDLVNEDKPISTGKLITSFGWSKEDALVQHDVQEFNLKLSEFLENRMKGTEAEGTFAYLFQGKIKTFIECINVPYKSEKAENFNDLQLTVKGCKNIYESFAKYTEEEIFNGNDQYDAEGFGKQDARKGLKFERLPNVLTLQLKRFEYNPTTYVLEKINDRFEYYDRIDLNQYVEGEGGYVYKLISVLVHSGSVNYGHYYCYCKADDRWVKFNDTNVKYADDYEVFESNYGGNFQIHRYLQKSIRNIELKSDSNTYVLVYIKESEKEAILAPVNNSDVKYYINLLDT